MKKYYDVKLYEDSMERESIRDVNFIQKETLVIALKRLKIQYKINEYDTPLMK